MTMAPHVPRCARLAHAPLGAVPPKARRLSLPAAAMANGRCRLHGGKSTGPKTPEGAERARQAALRHGFYTAARRSRSGGLPVLLSHLSRREQNAQSAAPFRLCRIEPMPQGSLPRPLRTLWRFRSRALPAVKAAATVRHRRASAGQPVILSPCPHRAAAWAIASALRNVRNGVQPSFPTLPPWLCFSSGRPGESQKPPRHDPLP